MTTIKQVSITTPAHVANLGKYLNDERALARESQHIVNESNWAHEMERTREAYGHNTPARAGKESAFMFHQILAFNPDECSANGGKMTPEKCMEYAREWVSKRYPNQEAIWVLHKEHCKADDTERFAIHIAINRTDLETGRRYNDGRSKNAKIERANAVRDMDRAWGLRQVEANERNSHVHARQPTRAEKEMRARGIRSDKQYLREAIIASMREVAAKPGEKPVRQLAASLEKKGVKMANSKDGNDLTFERVSTGRRVNGVSLGRGYSKAGIAAGLGSEVAGLTVKLHRKAFWTMESMAQRSMDN